MSIFIDTLSADQTPLGKSHISHFGKSYTLCFHLSFRACCVSAPLILHSRCKLQGNARVITDAQKLADFVGSSLSVRILLRDLA